MNDLKGKIKNLKYWQSYNNGTLTYERVPGGIVKENAINSNLSMGTSASISCSVSQIFIPIHDSYFNDWDELNERIRED